MHMKKRDQKYNILKTIIMLLIQFFLKRLLIIIVLPITTCDNFSVGIEQYSKSK